MLVRHKWENRSETLTVKAAFIYSIDRYCDRDDTIQRLDLTITELTLRLGELIQRLSDANLLDDQTILSLLAPHFEKAD